MGIMTNSSSIPANLVDPKMEAVIAYEKHYMRLLAQYQPQIDEILRRLAELREEERAFWDDLPRIEEALKKDEVLSQEVKEEWLCQYKSSMEASFNASKEVINHFVIKSLDEFKKELRKAKDRV